MPENKELCAQCGGVCCKHMAGMYAPSDFEKVSIETMMDILNTEQCSIDWWEGDPRTNIPEEDELPQTYFIRPRHVKAPIIDPSWGGICIFLSLTGCKLAYKDRPSNCRDLIPNIDNSKCHMIKTKANRVIEWIPYQDVLSKCYTKFNSK